MQSPLNIRKFDTSSEENELKEVILPVSIGKVFHVTSHEAFQGIKRDWIIKHNKNNEFKYSFSQSKNSYGRNRGYVCLFDLRNKSDQIIEDALGKLFFLDPFHPPKNKSIFLILKYKLYPLLIDYKQATEEIGYGEIKIPHVECWYPTNISLDDIDEIIDLTFKDRQK